MRIPMFPGRGPDGSMTRRDWDDLLCVAMLLAFVFVGMMTIYSFGGDR